MTDYIKNLIVSVLAGLAAYLNPISGDLKSLVALFFFNFLFGLAAGLLANNESFNLKKAFRCIIEATIFFVLVATIYFIGEHKGNPSGALQCVSFMTYIIIYFYGTNILRNLKSMAKHNSSFYKVVNFLYYVLSVEFIKRIPLLGNYQNEATSKDGA